MLRHFVTECEAALLRCLFAFWESWPCSGVGDGQRLPIAMKKTPEMLDQLRSWRPVLGP